MVVVIKSTKLLYLSVSLISFVILYFVLVRSYGKNGVNNMLPNQVKPIKPFTRYVNTELPTNKHINERIIHIDLKGAPPKVSYYRKIFPLLSELGATGILLEYEDMFPYSGWLANISAANAYSIEEISVINKLAKESNLTVIPLVQVFAHLEFILKLKEFKEFREVASYPDVICPTHKNTAFLLVTVIEQILRAHSDSDMIHIGTDEVNYLGQCNSCYQHLRIKKVSKNFLFLNHLKNVTSVLKIMYPKVRILMWDNQLRSMSTKEIEENGLNTIIEPIVLKYTDDLYDDLGPSLWENYGNTFSNVWAASAYKGTTDDTEFLSHFSKHLFNQKEWLSVFEEYKGFVNFRGIILAGWQRYDHFSVLSELFPVAIPSLAMSLRLLSGHVDPPLNPPTQIAKILRCKQPYALMSSAFGSPKCSYPGGDILEYVIQLQQLMQEYDAIIEDTRYARWMNEYHVKHSFSNPSKIESLTSFLGKIRNELSTVEGDITLALSEVYDEYTVNEWKETFIRPFRQRVETTWHARLKILMKDTWPRRPLIRKEL